ncbi:MAG: thioredoxin family protein [Bacillota bacterium]
MKLSIYGSGCKTCKTLYKNTQSVASGKNIEVEYITDLKLILSKGYMTMPVLEKDGVVISKGKLLTAKEIEALL